MKRIKIKQAVLLLCCILCIVESFAKSHPTPDNYSVGSIKGNASVSAMGAACYDFTFNVPNCGAMTPQIGLAYSSQNGGYGIAGHGFDITGISVITSGGKDLFHDGELIGAHYDAASSLYLDGKRLILKSGNLANGTAVYDVEGAPHTTINASGTFDMSYDVVTDTMWHAQTYPGQEDNYTLKTRRFIQIGTSFTVHAPDGTKYEYGSTDNAKIYFEGQKYDSSPIQALCAAWYLTKATDKYGNTIEYVYSKDSITHRIYPESIKYGVTYNAQGRKTRDGNYTITFVYDNLATTPQSYYIRNHKITTSKKLKEVYCRESSQLYRKYDLTYSTSIDNISSVFTRLTSVTESNGSGESLPPVTFEWNGIPSPNTSRNDISVNMDSSSLLGYLDKKRFFSFDVNNDGLTDLVRIDEKEFDEWGLGLGKLTVNIADKDCNGNISFSNPIDLNFITKEPNSSGVAYNVLKYPIDLNGDGTNEIFDYTYYETSDEAFVTYKLYRYENNALVQGRTGYFNLSGKTIPIITSIDWDGDGVDEILLLETSNPNNNNYGLHIVDSQYENSQYSTLNVDGTPRKLYTGDFDNDGRQDLMVVHDGGYKIFSKTGGEWNGQYSNYRAYYGYSVKNADQIEQGDFNGDGLVDFIMFTNDNYIDKYQIAYNNGNGKFSLSPIVAISGSINKVDDKPTLRKAVVLDIDGDGKSDVVTVQYGSSLTGSYIWDFRLKTAIKRFLSDGSGLQILDTNEYEGERSGYLDDGFIFLSDFDGDGIAELSNFGTRLDENNNTNYDNCIHIYKNNSLSSPGVGKIASVTDGFGVNTSFSYDVITNPDIYEKGVSSFPVNSYTIPVTVVRNKNTSFGNSVISDETFSYKDLKVHLQGKGVLGFSEVTKTDSILDTTVRTKVVNWNNTFWIPSKNKTWVTQGGTTATTETTNSITAFDNGKNYFSYASMCVETDFDGNTTTTTSLYDTTKGVPLTEHVANCSNMYKQTDYGNYVLKSGVWYPQSITTTQQHEDDDDDFIHTNNYTYDNLGNVTELVEGAGNEKELTTSSTYDAYGNILTKNGIKAGKSIIEHYDYDANGRYVTKSYQVPDLGTKVFKYGAFGVITEERDSISPNHVLVTKHEYDGWGRRTKTINPDSTYVEYNIVWNTGGGYKTIATPNNGPSVTTVYDALGRKISESTKGRKGVDIISSTVYNSLGQVTSVSKTVGNLTVGTSFTYDNRGRKTREESTSGAAMTYSYGNRSVTTSNGITSVTNTYDAWGNISESVDSLATVTYSYSSNGSPISITAKGNNETDGHTVYMEYDEWARKSNLSDPDAGTMSYTYTDDGVVKTQRDARGVTTQYFYENCGRLYRRMLSGVLTSYRYHQDGYGKYLPSFKATQGDSIKYEYDIQRRITKETRNFGTKRFSKSYEYDDLGNLSKVTYPGGLEVSYYYDASGFLDSVCANDSLIYHLDSYNGLTETRTGIGGMKLKDTYDSFGFLTKKKIQKIDGNDLLIVDLAYDSQTRNVTSKNIRLPEAHLHEDISDPIIIGKGDGIQTASIGGNIIDQPIVQIKNREDHDVYGYDSMDRLVSITNNNRHAMSIEYDECGNITNKTGIGNYSYDDSYKPHAVISVENTDSLAGSVNTFATYHSNGKLERLVMDSLELVNTYRIDDEKWKSQLIRNDSIIRTVFYFDDFEEICENDSTYLQYFLDNNVIVIKRNGSFEFYQGFTDHLGNILEVYDCNGQAVFEARYDAWGKQTVTKNEIGLRYGYTGHEMLPEFGLIDMKGRVYDPVLGRFLSPDNYVQEPTNSQSFNRYSYCVNNPLKYMDPDGEVWQIFVVAGIINWAMNGAQFNAKGLGYFATGAVASIITMGVGTFVGPITGAAAGGFVLGACNNWVQTGNTEHMMKSGAMGAVTGALSCSVGEYFSDIANKWFSKVTDMTLNSTLVGGTSGLMTGTLMGVISYANGAGGSLWECIGRSASIGLITGSASGFTSGHMKQSQFKKSEALSNFDKAQVNEITQGKPMQTHHFATDKNSRFTPEIKAITDKYNLDLNGEWNKEIIPHQGRHPNAYHQWVIRELNNIDILSQGNKQVFLNNFEIYVKQPVRQNPSMLNNKYWLEFK